MKKTWIVSGGLVLVCVAALWQTVATWDEPKVMPVVGASAKDWHPETFWYEPWGASVVHKGMDIFAQRGTPVVAATHHFILYQGERSRGGKNVWALGPRWRLHYYAHLETIADDLGGYIEAGTRIGTVGSTGNAQGKPPHLHYAIRLVIGDESRVDDATLGEQKAYWLNPIDYLAPTLGE